MCCVLLREELDHVHRSCAYELHFRLGTLNAKARIRAVTFFEISETAHPVTHRHIPEKVYFEQHC